MARYLGRFGSYHKALKIFTRFMANRPTTETADAPNLKRKMHKTGRGVSSKLRIEILERIQSAKPR